MKYDVDITALWSNDFKHICTPDGVQEINDLVKKPQKECVALLFSDGSIIECSTDHLIETTGGWVKAVELKENTPVISTSNVRFLELTHIGVHDVFDLEVNHKNHRYWSEGISSHNTGKSSTAEAIIREIGGEALWINASKEKGIDVLRGQVDKFASQSSFDDNIKIVVMDEFDNFSKDGMKAFRGFLDEYSQNCRFIFTGNYKENIITPLLDRLEIYDFNEFPKDEMIKPIFERLKWILENEKIEFNPKDLVPVINTFYPGIRSMVGTLQKFSRNSVFKISERELDGTDSFDNLMKFVSPGTYTQMITEVNKLNSPDNMYTYLYGNAGKYFKPEVYPNVVTVLAKYQDWSNGARDKSLTLAACLSELMLLRK